MILIKMGDSLGDLGNGNNSSIFNATYENISDGPVKDELIQNNEDIANEEAKCKEEKGEPQIVEIPPEIKEAAIKTLDEKLLIDPDSVVCEKTNIERSLSEYDFDGKHVKSIMTVDEYYTLIKELLNQGKIQDNGKK